MNLYLLTQSVNGGYDTYDSAVVAAETPEKAVRIHPAGYKNWNLKDSTFGSWADAKDVKAELIGTAVSRTKKSVICASFNAG